MVNAMADKPWPTEEEGAAQPTFEDETYNGEGIKMASLTTDDWESIPSPPEPSKKAEWQTYRQALRDLTYSNLNHGDTVTWPIEPS